MQVFQADMTSPTGAPVIAVCCHTVDGQGSHAAPGRNSARKARFKAQCATNIICQAVQHRVRSRLHAARATVAALASSQGHRRRDPSIIIAGDLNTFRAALMVEMGQMEAEEDTDMMAMNTGNLYVISDCEVGKLEGIPRMMGPDNQHEAAFMEVTLTEQLDWSSTPPPGDWAHVDNEVQEQAAKARQSSSRCKDDPAMAIVAINDGNDCHQ